MAKERQRLNLDLEALFPGDTLKIGDSVIHIRPLGLAQLAIIAKKLKGFGAILAEEGVTWDNYNEPENLVKIATLLIEKFPEVLEEGSNIAMEDIEELPVEVIVEILDKILEVNLASKEKLEGNFKSLAGRFLPAKKEEKPKSPKQSKS